MDDIERAWLAGLLEGEGYFGFGKGRGLVVQLAMTDEDIVRKVADIIDRPVRPQRRQIVTGKVVFVAACGKDARVLMEAVYSLMGARRQGAIMCALETANKRDAPRPFVCEECGAESLQERCGRGKGTFQRFCNPCRRIRLTRFERERYRPAAKLRGLGGV